MASRYVLPIRRAQALEALNKAGRTLAKRFSVDPPDLTPHKDPELDRIVQIENMATFLDGLAKATKPEKVEEPEQPSQEEAVAPQEGEVTAVSSAPPPPQDLEVQDNLAAPATEVQTPEVQTPEVQPEAPTKSAPVKGAPTAGKGASKAAKPQSAATKGKASKARK